MFPVRFHAKYRAFFTSQSTRRAYVSDMFLVYSHLSSFFHLESSIDKDIHHVASATFMLILGQTEMETSLS